MFLYHATSKENKEKIIKEGFKKYKGKWKENQWVVKYFVENIFGEGVYFSTEENYIRNYGEAIIKCEIDREYIAEKFIIINGRDTPKMISNINYLVRSKSYKAIEVFFKKGNYTEIVVYDTRILRILID